MSAIIQIYNQQEAYLRSLKEQKQKADAEAKHFADLIKAEEKTALTPSDVFCAALEEAGISGFYMHNDCSGDTTCKLHRLVNIQGQLTDATLCLKTGELLINGQTPAFILFPL